MHNVNFIVEMDLRVKVWENESLLKLLLARAGALVQESVALRRERLELTLNIPKLTNEELLKASNAVEKVLREQFSNIVKISITYAQ